MPHPLLIDHAAIQVTVGGDGLHAESDGGGR